MSEAAKAAERREHIRQAGQKISRWVCAMGGGSYSCFDGSNPFEQMIAPAVDAILAAEHNSWQPIETAPKDGTPIVVTAFVDGKWLFRVDYWRKYRMDFGEGFGWFAVSPTHWTVLPPLPLEPRQ